MLTQPYYHDEASGVSIYHGDCREILPTLQRDATDCVVTDPPYGIDYGRSGGFNATHGWGPWRENVSWDEQRPAREIFDAIVALNVPTVIWGGNYFTDYLPPSMGWIAWDKGQRDFSLADFEMAWTSEEKAARCVVYPRGNAVRDGKCHPTQKPVWVMQQSIEYLQRGRKANLANVLDPFMGVGTTLVAAKLLGMGAVGIELKQEYCDLAIKRLAQGVLFGAGGAA